ncbi:MAG: hypothetical protein P1P69_05810 [Methanosarcinaceae archaeon]|nr:hypothetical protein [Methanosarcinaceae archaeon]
MSNKIDYSEIASMLHSTFFGLENAHNKLTGSSHRAVVPEIAKILPLILDAKGELAFDESKSLEKELQMLEDHFNNDEFFDKVTIEKLDDSKYAFNINGCFLAKSGVHDVLKPDHNTCMFAYIVASALSIRLGKNLRISSSEFTQYDSTTIIELV